MTEEENWSSLVPIPAGMYGNVSPGVQWSQTRSDSNYVSAASLLNTVGE